MSRGTEILAGRPAACWRRSTQRRFGSMPEVHDELVVLFATHGQMNYLIDGEVVRMRPGLLLFAYAGQAHVLLSETRGFDMWVFLVSGQLLPRKHRGQSLPALTLAEAAGMLGPKHLGISARNELNELARTIAEEEDHDRQLHGIKWWLGRAWGYWQTTKADRAQRLHPALDQAALAIKRDPSRDLVDLAAEVRVSPEHLGRLFRKEFGEGFVSFRNRARLTRLDGILEVSPQSNLLQSALDAGFGSYPQFFRTFQKLRGQSPWAYYKKGNSALPRSNER